MVWFTLIRKFSVLLVCFAENFVLTMIRNGRKLSCIDRTVEDQRDRDDAIKRWTEDLNRLLQRYTERDNKCVQRY